MSTKRVVIEFWKEWGTEEWSVLSSVSPLALLPSQTQAWQTKHLSTWIINACRSFPKLGIYLKGRWKTPFSFCQQRIKAMISSATDYSKMFSCSSKRNAKYTHLNTLFLVTSVRVVLNSWLAGSHRFLWREGEGLDGGGKLWSSSFLTHSWPPFDSHFTTNITTLDAFRHPVFSIRIC